MVALRSGKWSVNWLSVKLICVSGPSRMGRVWGRGVVRVVLVVLVVLGMVLVGMVLAGSVNVGLSSSTGSTTSTGSTVFFGIFPIPFFLIFLMIGCIGCIGCIGSSGILFGTIPFARTTDRLVIRRRVASSIGIFPLLSVIPTVTETTDCFLGTGFRRNNVMI